MRHVVAVVAVAICTVAGALGQDTAKTTFDHYEEIRLALSTDTLKGIPEHAAALAQVAAIGAEGKKATERLRTATDLKDARQHFGALSAALLPTFEKAQLKDVYLYTCSMANQSWAQRGKPIQNPYYGKAMAACGVPAKPAK